MRAILFAFAALLCLVLAGWSFSGSEAANAPETDMVVAMPLHSAFTPPSMGQVVFPHARHKRIDGTVFECTFCHHKWNQTNDPGKCSAPSCHDALTPQTAGPADARAFRSAFHGLADFSCTGCHGLRVQAGKSHGPIACDGCHGRNLP